MLIQDFNLMQILIVGLIEGIFELIQDGFLLPIDDVSDLFEEEVYGFFRVVVDTDEFFLHLLVLGEILLNPLEEIEYFLYFF